MNYRFLPIYYFMLTAVIAGQAKTLELSDDDVFKKLKSLNVMRETLASAIPENKPVTEDTFKAVCKPVGLDFKNWAENNKVLARQLSHKNRNEMHAVPIELSKAYKEFQKDSSLEKKKIFVKMSDFEGDVYLYRIRVVSSCLGCHGEKDSRPDFVKKNYKNDKAFDFKVGDLRGIYAVFKPVHKKK